MRLAVTITVVLFLTVAILIALGVSAVANWYFGASLGSNEPFTAIFFTTTTSELFSWASLSADILKAFSLFFVFIAIANKQVKEALALGAIWAICTFWSLNSAAGFVALNHATVVDNRGHSATNWVQLDKEIKRLEERRSWIPEHRPVETVQADLAGKETAYLFARTAGCTDVTQKGSREFCDQVSGLRREHANAKAAADLDKQLQDRRQEQKGTAKITSADPYAEMLAGVMGIDASQASTGRALYFAIMAELISALGLWAVWSIFFAGRKEASGLAKASPAIHLATRPTSPAQPRTPLPEAPIAGLLSRKAGNSSNISSSSPEPTPPADSAPPPVDAPAPVETPPARPVLVDENWKPAAKPKGKPSKLAKFADIDAPTKAWLDTGRAIPVALSLGSSGPDVWDAYNNYCLAQMPPIKPLNPSHLGRSLRRVGVASAKTSRGVRYALRLVKMPVRRAA